MSTSSPLSSDHLARRPVNVGSLASRIKQLLLRPIVALAFWLGVLLPLVHIPLAATGLETTTELLQFAGLLGLNVLTLVVGHGHRRG